MVNDMKEPSNDDNEHTRIDEKKNCDSATAMIILIHIIYLTYGYINLAFLNI